MAVTAGGAISDYKTTPLMTWEEGVEAMRAARATDRRAARRSLNKGAQGAQRNKGLG
jgi:hypothetical protein